MQRNLWTIFLVLGLALCGCKGDSEGEPANDDKKDASEKVKAPEKAKKPAGPPPVNVADVAGLRIPGGGKLFKTDYKGVDVYVWSYKLPRPELLARVKSQLQSDGWLVRVDDSEHKKDASKSIKLFYKKAGKSEEYVFLGWKKKTSEATVVFFQPAKKSASSVSGTPVTLPTKGGMRLPPGGVVTRLKDKPVKVTYSSAGTKAGLKKVIDDLFALFKEDGWLLGKDLSKKKGMSIHFITKGSMKFKIGIMMSSGQMVIMVI